MHGIPGGITSQRESELFKEFKSGAGWSLAWAWRGFRGLLKRRRMPANPVDAFQAIDPVGEFIEEFNRLDNNPSRAGRIDGSRTWPRPDDPTNPDFVEAIHARTRAYGGQIVSSANKVVAQLHQAIVEQGRNLKEMIEHRSLQAIEVDLPNTETMFAKTLVDVSVDREAAQVALNSFVDEYDLQDEIPNEPASLERFCVIACIALIIEACINGVMLQDATDGGFRSAAFYGSLPALLNMILGISCGCACRYRFVKQQPSRAAGWILVVLAVVVCLMLAGTIGTWRALAQNQDLDKIQGLLPIFIAHPLAWADSLMAIFLFLFSVVTFVVAFVHGELMTGHRFPGFAAKWWDVRDKTHDLNQIVGEVTGATKAIIEEAGVEIQELEREAGTSRATHCESLNELNRLHNATTERLGQLTTEANRLRFEYALKNKRIRGATPLPPALLRSVTFDYGWGGCAANADDKGLQWHEERVTETNSASRIAQTNIIKARTKCLTRLRAMMEAAHGEASTDLPGPPLPSLNGDMPLYYGPIKKEFAR